MRYVVTGGCGFIGSNFIRYIYQNEPDAKVLNIDKWAYSANLSCIDEFKKYSNYDFAYGDIANLRSIQHLIQEDDIIINFAAESHVDRSIENSQVFINSNVVGVDNLLQVARKKKISKFIQISTDEVYGALSFTDKPKKENDHFAPSSPYSASKAAAELLCRSAIITYGTPIMITRSSNNYGPYQYPEKLIPLFISRILKKQKVPLYGNGQNIRDWIHVNDNCAAIYKVVHSGTIGETYNIGGGNQVSNLEITKKILRILSADESQIEFVTDRLGHDLRYDIDSSKIMELGWAPKCDFDDGLQQTVEWYKYKNDSKYSRV